MRRIRKRGTIGDMTTVQLPPPTTVQVLAARLRVKADKRLKRDTPADIKAIADQATPASTTELA